MEPITTRDKLIEGLKNLLSVEISAKNSYEKDIKIFENKKIIIAIDSIRKDELVHIELLKELIEILEK
ncbi:MAG: hypothetical protein WC867_07500 [Candidatus Pacearchaeota archaeon]|jgi:rubrerythrin